MHRVRHGHFRSKQRPHCGKCRRYNFILRFGFEPLCHAAVGQQNQKVQTPKPAVDPPAALVREHVLQVLASTEFHSSKRSRDFLRCVVQAALDEHPKQIKERAIAEVVFNRPDYDPSTDTLVRVSAAEVRKRLAKFYESHSETPVRIHIPAGGYLPEFRVEQPPVIGLEPAAVAPPNPSRKPSKTWLAIASKVVLVALGALKWFVRDASPLNDFWKPLIEGAESVIVSNPSGGGNPRCLVYPGNVEEFQRTLRSGAPSVTIAAVDIVESDQSISLGNTQAILSIAGFLRVHRRGAMLRIATDLLPGDTRNHPLILIGAFNNAWTLDLSASQRFRFVSEGRGTEFRAGVLDTSSGKTWFAQLRKRAWDADLDYSLVSRVWNSSGQVVLSVAGVSHLGTQAAADLVTNPQRWAEVVRRAPPGWQHKNLEILLETKIVGKSVGTPRLMDCHFW